LRQVFKKEKNYAWSNSGGNRLTEKHDDKLEAVDRLAVVLRVDDQGTVIGFPVRGPAVIGVTGLLLLSVPTIAELVEPALAMISSSSSSSTDSRRVYRHHSYTGEKRRHGCQAQQFCHLLLGWRTRNEEHVVYMA
jgi:hypothetical protein